MVRRQQINPVVNRVGECYDGKGKPILFIDLAFVVIHRLSLAHKTEENPNPVPDASLDAMDIVEIFKNHGMGTGGRPPYHIIIRRDPLGTIEQILPIMVQGAHAIGYNSRSIAVAVIGNSDERPPTSEQHAGLVKVCQTLCRLNHGLQLVGHTDLPGAPSGDPSKKCPGQYLPLGPVIARACVCDRPYSDPWWELQREGFEI